MNLLWAILITLGVSAAGVAAMLLVRRRAPQGSHFQDGDRAAGVFGVLATGCAVFAGFVIFLAFTTYDQSRNGAETEALVIAQQFETAQFLPEKVRRRLSGELVCYARAVLHREWPQTGSAVALAPAAREELEKDGIGARVVSMPYSEPFDRQPQDYRDAVLPPSIRARVAAEQASALGWHRYVSDGGAIVAMHTCGASAPLEQFVEKFGFTPDAVADVARKVLA